MPDSLTSMPLSTKAELTRHIWMAPLLIGLGALYLPTYLVLARTVWASDEQGHGPIILAISLWLMWRSA